MSSLARKKELAKHYRDYYKIPDLLKVRSRPAMTAKLLTRLRLAAGSAGGRVELAIPHWTAGKKDAPELPAPTAADVAFFEKKSVQELIALGQAFNDYYGLGNITTANNDKMEDMVAGKIFNWTEDGARPFGFGTAAPPPPSAQQPPKSPPSAPIAPTIPLKPLNTAAMKAFFKEGMIALVDKSEEEEQEIDIEPVEFALVKEFNLTPDEVGIVSQLISDEWIPEVEAELQREADFKSDLMVILKEEAKKLWYAAKEGGDVDLSAAVEATVERGKVSDAELKDGILEWLNGKALDEVEEWLQTLEEPPKPPKEEAYVPREAWMKPFVLKDGEEVYGTIADWADEHKGLAGYEDEKTEAVWSGDWPYTPFRVWRLLPTEKGFPIHEMRDLGWVNVEEERRGVKEKVSKHLLGLGPLLGYSNSMTGTRADGYYIIDTRP